MSVVLVDWLGRGGIAQCTESWAITLEEAGIPAIVVTRPGRELGAGLIKVEAPEATRNRVLAHRNLARHAAEVILREQPATVVIQNYVIPYLERPVYQAAHRIGARLVVTVHDHRLHTWRAGSSLGLVALLRRADTVLSHSQFVGDAVQSAIGRTVEVLPLPVQLGLLRAAPAELTFACAADRYQAIHFGILRRAYKGTDTALELADSMPPGWELVLLGVGAPRGQGATTVDRFVAPGELVAAVGAARVTLLPYRLATQSGAIVLAQALGSVPIASSVGGIPEQITDGRTGRLLPPGAPVAAWRSAIAELGDSTTRDAMVLDAKRQVWANHDIFSETVRAIGAGRPT